MDVITQSVLSSGNSRRRTRQSPCRIFSALPSKAGPIGSAIRARLRFFCLRISSGNRAPPVLEKSSQLDFFLRACRVKPFGQRHVFAKGGSLAVRKFPGKQWPEFAVRGACANCP